MRFSGLLVATLLVGATATTAAADGIYFSESFGGTDVKDDLAVRMDSAMRIRVAAGYRWRNLAIEGWFGGDLSTDGRAGFHDGAPPPSSCGVERCYPLEPAQRSSGLFEYGIDVKWLRPVTPRIDLYLRGGFSYALLDGGEYGGRGLGIGAGAQIKGKVPVLGLLFWPLFFTGWGPKITAAAFIEDGYAFYRLHRDGVFNSGKAIDAQLNHLSVGFAFGTDF